MKQKILLLAFSAAILTGCSTAYQAGQTPDDVYYSPATENVARQDRRIDNRDRYQEYTNSEDDNYLRRKIQNRARWSAIDDFDYWYNPNYNMVYGYNPYRNFGYNPYIWNNWHSPFNSPWGFNNWYGGFNPYFSHGIYGGYGFGRGFGFGSGFGYGGGIGYYQPVFIVKNPVRPTNVSRPQLGNYRNSNYSNRNNSNFGNMMKRVFTPDNNTYSNSNNSSRQTYEAPSRSYNPSSSSGSSRSSGSSSGGTVTRPARGGN